MGSPSMLHGIDVVRAAPTYLHQVRVAALCAALPPGPSRNVDIGFAILDAGGTALDPAGPAHALPVRHWGMALWEAWAPLQELQAIFDLTLERLRDRRGGDRSLWAVAAGPVAGLILTVWRLQWRCLNFRLFVDDLGDSVDFLGMSPPMVAAAAQRSAVRWRARRILAHQPTLADVHAGGLRGADGSQLSLLVARPIGQLLKGRGRPTRTVPQWTPQCRSYLLSAATGGQ